jgi:hypothetical protein
MKANMTARILWRDTGLALDVEAFGKLSAGLSSSYF